MQLAQPYLVVSQHDTMNLVKKNNDKRGKKQDLKWKKKMSLTVVINP
jgi:hypothetical protein